MPKGILNRLRTQRSPVKAHLVPAVGLALLCVFRAASAWPASFIESPAAQATARVPVIVPALNFSVGFDRIVSAGSLNAFALELSRAAEPSRAKAARAQDPLRLASLYTIIDAALTNDKRRAESNISAVKAGVAGEAAAEAPRNLRAAIKRESDREAAALQSIKDLHARLQKDKRVARALAEAFDDARDSKFGNYVLINSKGDPETLHKIVRAANFPRDAEVFTHEESLVNTHDYNAALRKPGARNKWTPLGLESTIEPYRKIAEEKNLKLWLGHLLNEDGRLFNAYSLVTKNGIERTQRKKFLWKTETLDAAEKWEGRFGKLAILICSEVSAFWDVLAFDKKPQIELRQDPPKIVVIPAHWARNKEFLLTTARAIAHPLWHKIYNWKKGDVPVTGGVRPEGIPVFVINHTDAYAVGPADAMLGPAAAPNGGARITRTHAELHVPGYIQINKGRASVVPLK